MHYPTRPSSKTSHLYTTSGGSSRGARDMHDVRTYNRELHSTSGIGTPEAPSRSGFALLPLRVSEYGTVSTDSNHHDACLAKGKQCVHEKHLQLDTFVIFLLIRPTNARPGPGNKTPQSRPAVPLKKKDQAAFREKKESMNFL